jgi:acetolactate synthase-1/2/3 large subunit
VQRLVGTLNKTLPLLREQLGAAAGPTSWSAAEIANHRTHYFQGMTIAAANGLSSSDVVQAAADIFANAPTGRPRLAVDAGAHMFSACTFWPAREALDVLISNGLATMGFAVPPAIAAALHEPARGAVAITGDGGFMMSFGELKTAFETQANVCIIVFNDGCLSLIDLKRADRQLPDFGLSWKRPDFAVVASAFALPSWRVDDRAQLGPALQAAVAEKGPSLVDVHIDASGYPAQTLALRG